MDAGPDRVLHVRATSGPEGSGTDEVVEAGLQKAESLGGTRVMGPMDVPGGPQLGFLNDPEGHMVGLVKGM